MNKKLKAKIFEKYGTQADFADVANVDESKISRVIRGRRTLNPDDQRHWASLLDSTAQKLFKE